MTQLKVGNKVSFVNPELTWDATPEDHAQAMKNHYQTIERLNERGGLTWCEFLAVIEHRPYRQIDLKVAHQRVQEVLLSR